MTTYQHLSNNAAEKLLLTDEERIFHIKKQRWITYSKANELLDKLEDLFNHPPQSRMPNMLIVGDTNNGKTMLVNRFREKHPPQMNLDGDAAIIPILYIQAPPTPDERGIYNAILTRLFEPYSRSEATDSRRDRVVSVLRKVQLQMIMIDEVQHLLAGSYAKQRGCLNVLKYLGNELCVPIVGIGTAESIRAIQTDPQLANRFTPELLPKWTMGQDFLRLLLSFERVIPLREPSNLAAPELADAILRMANYTIGEVSQLLNKAAIYAIKTKQECITFDSLINCGYISPDDRKQAAARL